ncbi:lysozyme g-like [Alosa pseudoharengus]|uniref:lysozyme g-like n=1 Tax=Alosa pseudoharengus TaxID=34774 RepID=UPI003F8B53C6
MWNAEEMGQQFDPLNMRLSQAADTLSLALQVKHRDQLQMVFSELRRQKEDEEDRRADLDEWQTIMQTLATSTKDCVDAVRETVDGTKRDVNDVQDKLGQTQKAIQDIKAMLEAVTNSQSRILCGSADSIPPAPLEANVGRYGDVMKTETTGASAATARQDGNNEISGKPASFELAETDLERMNEYKDIIIKVGRGTGVDPAVIAGIISRASRAGSEYVLEDGWNANRDTFGLMQIAKQWNKLKGDWDSEEHIKQGTGILISSIRDIKRRFPNWTKEQQLKGGIAAYYAGPRNVPAEYEKVDENTFAKDYSNDVVARAQFYREHGFL